jgi:DNA-binding protein Fis
MDQHEGRRGGNADFTEACRAILRPLAKLLKLREGDVEGLEPVANLLEFAIERDRQSVLEQELRGRREKLQALLPAIAEAFDIRQVFPRLSTLMQGVIPHTTVSLALLNADRSGVRIHVASNFEVAELPEYRFTTDMERIGSAWHSFLAYDIQVMGQGAVRAQISPPGVGEPVFVELRPGTPWTRIVSELDLRSTLRVPIRIRDQPVGAISFGSNKPAAYGDDDVDLAARIADHVALAIAHERLTDEGRRAMQAEERERSLQVRVDTLVGELDSIGAFPPEGVKLEAIERDLLRRALAQAKNNKSQAAKLLGLQRGRFYALLRRHGLTSVRR